MNMSPDIIAKKANVDNENKMVRILDNTAINHQKHTSILVTQ